MTASNDILISVEERHASNMLAGNKSVELRRKNLIVSPGTRVWIYSKLPRGQIQAIAIIDAVICSTPTQIWDRYGAQCAISKREFDEYFFDAEIGYAIIIEEIKPLAPFLSLASIREKISHFHPPQFFKRLAVDSTELAYFKTALLQA